MLGEALRLIRVYHSLKQKDAATRLNISTSYLSEIEHGHKEPTLDLIKRYSSEFKLPVSAIMFFSETMGSKKSVDKARTFVAEKAISLLKFIETRADQNA